MITGQSAAPSPFHFLLPTTQIFPYKRWVSRAPLTCSIPVRGCILWHQGEGLSSGAPLVAPWRMFGVTSLGSQHSFITQHIFCACCVAGDGNTWGTKYYLTSFAPAPPLEYPPHRSHSDLFNQEPYHVTPLLNTLQEMPSSLE